MILLVHNKAHNVVEVLRNTAKISSSVNICETFWRMAEEFPEEILIWVEQDLYPLVRKEKIIFNFDHELVMSSYAVEAKFFSEAIGYIDQLPFINVKRGIKYPTWRMSSDIGGITGKTVLKFYSIFKNISDFTFLLNSIAKLGQQNGLFCYSDPDLIYPPRENEPVATAGSKELFSFVYQHYKTVWLFILFFCFIKYEKRFPLASFFHSFTNPKLFKRGVDLSEIKIADGISNLVQDSSVDVIIPTIGRSKYVRQVVEDFGRQSLVPKRVIIVEQQPEESIKSELQDLLEKEFPFQIIHIFTHQTGACMARNRALAKVESEWIFFADDDIRIAREVLANTLEEAKRLKVDCINLNCKQPGEETVFHKVKQWGSFGSGTSVVRSSFARNLRFSEVFEHGYGEDADFGMKLREKGCDIIYHPKLEIQHLKAPVGGFRKKPVLAWEKDIPRPKPSPTLMILAKRYYTPEQIKGYKLSLYLKYFRNQNIKNPLTYLSKMERNWKRSEDWAERLESDMVTSKDNRLKRMEK